MLVLVENEGCVCIGVSFKELLHAFLNGFKRMLVVFDNHDYLRGLAACQGGVGNQHNRRCVDDNEIELFFEAGDELVIVFGTQKFCRVGWHLAAGYQEKVFYIGARNYVVQVCGMQKHLRKSVASFDGEFLVQSAFAQVGVNQQYALAGTSVEGGQVDGHEALSYTGDEPANTDDGTVAFIHAEFERTAQGSNRFHGHVVGFDNGERAGSLCSVGITLGDFRIDALSGFSLENAGVTDASTESFLDDDDKCSKEESEE